MPLLVPASTLAARTCDLRQNMFSRAKNKFSRTRFTTHTHTLKHTHTHTHSHTCTHIHTYAVLERVLRWLGVQCICEYNIHTHIHTTHTHTHTPSHTHIPTPLTHTYLMLKYVLNRPWVQCCREFAPFEKFSQVSALIIFPMRNHQRWRFKKSHLFKITQILVYQPQHGDAEKKKRNKKGGGQEKKTICIQV